MCETDSSFPFKAKMVIFFSFAYCLGLVIVNTLFEWQIFNIYNVCLFGNEAPVHQNGLQIVVFQIPVVLLIIFTIALDIRSYFKINVVVPHTVRNSDLILSKEAVLTSFHVSVTSTISIIPYLLYLIVLNNLFEGLTPQKTYLAIMIPSTIINLFRNPIILMLTSRYSRGSMPYHVKPEKAATDLSIVTLN